MNKMTRNRICRLSAALFLVAAMSFLAACGDDDTECGDNEVYSSAEDTCFTLCTDGSGCADDEICKTANPGSDDDRKICKTDPNANNDNGNNDQGCAEGEMEIDLGNGPSCYTTCTDDASVCTGNEQCSELTDGSGSVCFEPPSGNASCSDVFDCIYSCETDDTQCQQSCFESGSLDAQDQFNAMSACFDDNCGGPNDGQECFKEQCGEKMATCGGCESADKIIPGLGLSCVTKCNEDTECDGQKTCVDPLLVPDADYKVCSYNPEGLGDTCTDDSTCGGPDPANAQPQSGGFCTLGTDAAEGDEATCLALGCDASSQYGGSTGCGYEAICQSQAGQNPGDAPVTFCAGLCDEQSDCAGDAAVCRPVEISDNGDLLGLCEGACETDADCELTDGTQGRCNADNICELPCSEPEPGETETVCAQSGGTCDGDDFCVYEEAAAN